MSKIALIIAAGEGSRLIEEGSATIKPLIELNGAPMVDRLIRILKEAGFDSIGMIINESSEAVKDYIVFKNFDIPIEFIVSDTPSSLHSFEKVVRLAGAGDSFYLFTVDTVFKTLEFKEFVEFCESSLQYDAIMGITSYIDDEKPLYAEIKKDTIRAFRDEKNNCEFVTGGLYYFRRNPAFELAECVNSGLSKLRNFLRFLIEKKYKIGYFDFSKIIDVDHISDIKKAEVLLKNEIKHNLINGIKGGQ
jgi:NDP-sugar pyrophosphorylase family protein